MSCGIPRRPCLCKFATQSIKHQPHDMKIAINGKSSLHNPAISEMGLEFLPGTSQACAKSKPWDVVEMNALLTSLSRKHLGSVLTRDDAIFMEAAPFPSHENKTTGSSDVRRRKLPGFLGSVSWEKKGKKRLISGCHLQNWESQA